MVIACCDGEGERLLERRLGHVGCAEPAADAELPKLMIAPAVHACRLTAVFGQRAAVAAPERHIEDAIRRTRANVLRVRHERILPPGRLAPRLTAVVTAPAIRLFALGAVRAAVVVAAGDPSRRRLGDRLDELSFLKVHADDQPSGAPHASIRCGASRARARDGDGCVMGQDLHPALINLLRWLTLLPAPDLSLTAIDPSSDDRKVGSGS